MLRTILVPLDGSCGAETALPIAARIARHTGATLVLVYITNLATATCRPAMTVPDPTVAQASMNADLAESSPYLETIATSRELADLNNLETVVQVDPMISPLLPIAISRTGDLIVVCSHDLVNAIQGVLGNLPQQLADQASVSILVLPQGGTRLEENPVLPLRVLVPLDGSEQAAAVLEPVAELLTALAMPGQKKALSLTRVVRPLTEEQKDEVRLLHKACDLTTRARRDLRHTAKQIQAGLLAPNIVKQHMYLSGSVVCGNDVAETIIHTADPGGCDRYDMIAICTYGSGGFQRPVLGQTTERVLHTTKLPLLIVQASETEKKQSLIAAAR